jgi:hypothetical protein
MGGPTGGLGHLVGIGEGFGLLLGDASGTPVGDWAGGDTGVGLTGAGM